MSGLKIFCKLNHSCSPLKIPLKIYHIENFFKNQKIISTQQKVSKLHLNRLRTPHYKQPGNMLQVCYSTYHAIQVWKEQRTRDGKSTSTKYYHQE